MEETLPVGIPSDYGATPVGEDAVEVLERLRNPGKPTGRSRSISHEEFITEYPREIEEE